MNPFTTDHPLASQSSWFDIREHPKLSFLCTAVSVALILAPCILICLYRYVMSDIGAEPNPFPEPWRALLWGGVVAFVIAICAAIPIVWLGRLLRRAWRKRHNL